VEHPKAIGDRSTLAIMLALGEAGYDLLVPFGENTRYDLVIDDGDRLARVQCKTGRLRNGAITFNTCSSYAHHSNPRVIKRDYQGEIDYFAVFCPETRAANWSQSVRCLSKDGATCVSTLPVTTSIVGSGSRPIM
jgi:hypothetical protein